MSKTGLLDTPFKPAPQEILEQYRDWLGEALGFKRAVDEEGNVVDESLLPKIPESKLVEIHEYMVRARVIDSWLLRLQRMGRVALHAPNKGQEAVAVGATMPLRPDDWVFPSYRELGAYLVRGMSEEEILDRALANADDPLKGSDFAIYGNRKYNLVPAPVPVGNQIPLAVGAAYAMRYMGRDTISLTFFGDGATSRGDFHVGLNFAGVFKVPAVFVVQNNQWAISVPRLRQTASPTIAVKALAYGVPGLRLDGNDALVVYKVVSEAADKARRGEGPTLIEAVTYRLGPHTTADDPSRYRPEEEVRHMERYEPLRRLRKFLEKNGIMTEREALEVEREWDKRVEEIARKVLSKPELPKDVFFENVYKEEPWFIAEERRDLEEVLRLMQELGLGDSH
ncbi:MAG: pyruvate dehydrogenase (acetyl-transferring) E1 component subunit alpha [Aeropyrum sp.]|nr:pyruvate dehydrogenase (acetyl-transferring) E1 component subunit alpha [Aeropyrum sp.]MCE4615584.1 pyruvate dehydrogenase (acetyl-transferring) E1 component subunit alpha [Aeropyrum sp.]